MARWARASADGGGLVDAGILSMEEAREYALRLGATEAVERDGLLCVRFEEFPRVAEYRFSPANLYKPFMRHEIGLIRGWLSWVTADGD